MKIRIFLLLPFFVLLFGGTTNNIHEEYLKNEERAFVVDTSYNEPIKLLDSLDFYLQKARKCKEKIKDSKKVIQLNVGYSKNIQDKKETKKKDIQNLVVEVTDIVEEKVLEKTNKTVFTDTICKKRRGFIGNKILMRSKCKKWEYSDYYLNKDSVKIYINK